MTRTTIGVRSSRSVAETRRGAAGVPARTTSISLRLAAPPSPRQPRQCRVDQPAEERWVVDRVEVNGHGAAGPGCRASTGSTCHRRTQRSALSQRPRPPAAKPPNAGALLALANDASSPPSSLSRVNHPINSVRITLSRSRGAVRKLRSDRHCFCVGVGSGGAAGALAG